MPTAPVDRRIKFLARDLPFPTDPTFREYRKVEELTGVTAQDIMLGQAGVWMLPVLAIVALMRDNKHITTEQLDRILDLSPGEIEVTGLDEEEVEEDSPPVEEAAAEKSRGKKSTGTKSTPETQEKSGTQDSPTTSPEQPESPTT